MDLAVLDWRGVFGHQNRIQGFHGLTGGTMQSGFDSWRLLAAFDLVLAARGCKTLVADRAIHLTEERSDQMKRFILIAGLILALLALGAYFGGGYMVYDRLSKVVVDAENLDNNPASFHTSEEYASFDTRPYQMPAYEEISFPSRGTEIMLEGWYIETDPAAPVVLLTHGGGGEIPGSKRAPSILIPAGILARNGFNVLVYDLRNYGDSGRDNGRTAVGNKEFQDVLGAWDWLANVKGFAPGRIGLYGISLGGGTTLIAFGQEPRAAAAFVDSPLSDLPRSMDAALERNGYPTLLRQPAIIMARVVGGVDLLAHSPTEAILNHNGRPLYIVHGVADPDISVDQTYALMALAEEKGANLTLWLPHRVGHVGAVFMWPQQYEVRLVGFFREALGQGAAY
jgi:dipeptidyl aminopeptidase/acylaminoacyl peptidase